MSIYHIDLEKHCKFLTKEEELHYCRLKDEGDIEARQKLIKSVLPWALKLATRWCKISQLLPDLIQEANLAVIKSIDDFDATKGRLSTWVKYKVDCAVRRKREELQELIHIPNYLKYGKKGRKEPLSAQEERLVNGEVEFSNHYPDENIWKEYACEIEIQENESILANLLTVLDERSRDIVFEYHWTNTTYQEIGDKYNLSKERVRQILNAAYKRMKDESERIPGFSGSFDCRTLNRLSH